MPKITQVKVRPTFELRACAPNSYTGLPPNTIAQKGNQALVGFPSLWLGKKLEVGLCADSGPMVEPPVKEASALVWPCARSGGGNPTVLLGQLQITLPVSDTMFFPCICLFENQ